MVNIRQLECFQSVMATGQMVGAARDLQISQPAVSKMIDALEYELGLKLFERRRGRIEPTPEARIILTDIAAGIAAVEKVKRTAQEIKRNALGSITVVGPPGFAMHSIPQAISDLLRDGSDVQVKIISRTTRTLDEVLSAQKFDVAVLHQPVSHLSVVLEPFALRCVCILPKGHPLCEERVITPMMLDNVRLISLTEEHLVTNTIKKLLAAVGVKHRATVEAQFFLTAVTLVQEGVGISIIDPITAALYEGENLIVRPFEPAVNLHFALAFPADRPQSQLTKKFSRLIKHRLGVSSQ
nr:LysR substrate-binding domain-containing protein [uncultured Roseovarius sp.]